MWSCKKCGSTHIRLWGTATVNALAYQDPLSGIPVNLSTDDPEMSDVLAFFPDQCCDCDQRVEEGEEWTSKFEKCKHEKGGE